MKKFDWLRKFYEHRNDEDASVSVSNLLPNEFDDYFLIHWNVGIVDGFPFNEYPEKNETIEETNSRIRIDRKYGLFLNPNETELFRETTLKEIAVKFNKEYHYDLLNRIKQTPAIKVIANSTKINLKNWINAITKNDLLNLFIEDIIRYPVDQKPNQEIENLSVTDYFNWQEDFYYDYYTFLFPTNKKWCITTGEDLPMFLCSKKEDTIEIINSTKLELFKVNYEEKLYRPNETGTNTV